MQLRATQHWIPRILLTALLTTIPSVVPGASVYTSQGEFTNHLSAGYYFTNFESFAVGDQGSANVSLAGGTPSFSVTIATVSGMNNTLWIANGTLPTGKALSTSAEATDILFTFTSSNVTAVGGNFFLSSIEEDRTTGSLDVTLSDGTSRTISSTSNAPVEFRGFTTDASNPITSLRLHPGSQYVTLDNLYMGAVMATNAPQPVLSTQRIDLTHIEISWPLSGVAYVLRSKSTLPGDIWTDVLEADVPSNGFHRVTVNSSTGMRFFQLQRP